MIIKMKFKVKCKFCKDDFDGTILAESDTRNTVDLVCPYCQELIMENISITLLETKVTNTD